MRFVVTELGNVDEDSIEVEGDVSDRLRAHLVERAAGWRYRPARVGDCWVASTLSWSFKG